MGGHCLSESPMNGCLVGASIGATSLGFVGYRWF